MITTLPLTTTTIANCILSKRWTLTADEHHARAATSNCQPDGFAAPISCLFARSCLERGGGACESLDDDDDGDCSESAAAADGSKRGTLGRLSGAPVSETKLGAAGKTKSKVVVCVERGTNKDCCFIVFGANCAT